MKQFNLTIAEKQEWKQLRDKVKLKSTIIYDSKNEETEKEFDDAVDELMTFEKMHGIDK